MNERKSIIGAEVGDGFITFNVAGAGQMQLMVSKCPEDVLQRAMYHGFEQKVRDAGAIARNPKTGRSATPQEKFEAMNKVIEQLHAGQWNVKATSAQALNRAALFEAVAEVRGVLASVVEAKFRDRPDNVLKQFLEHRDIAAAYAKRTAKDSGAADELLAELE